jgi:CheY-like chemotaxis protein
MSMRGILLAGLLSMFACLPVLAQPAAPAPAAARDGQPDPMEDPYIRELVRRSRGNNTQLAGSIRDALRLKLDTFASQFLVTLAGRNVEAQESAAIAREISADRLLRVVIEPQFPDPAKKMATDLLAALQAYDEDPARLLPAIEKLKSDSADERLPAMRTVLAGGLESIALLSVAVAKEPNPTTRDELLRVMLRLGEGGRTALKQLAIYGDDSLRAGALAALIRLGGDDLLALTLAALHDPNSTDAEIATAEKWLLRRYKARPSKAEAETYLVGRLQEIRDAVPRTSLEPNTAVLWTIGPDRASVVHTNVDSLNAPWRGVIDHARLIHRLGELSDEARLSAMGADLAYRYQLDPLSVDESSDDLKSLWGDAALSPLAMINLIETAIEEGDLVVAVAALRLVDESMQAEAGALMTTHSELLTPLVDAASHPQPRLRFEAASAIARLAFKEQYAGSSYVMQRWLEMASLSREPIVMVIETRLEVLGQIERIWSSLGYRVESVPSVEDAVLAIDRGGDVRFILSTTMLSDRPSIEMIDTIRRRPLGRDIPVVLYGAVDAGVTAAVEEKRWAAPVVHVELPGSAAGWSLIMEPLEVTRLLPTLSAVERLDFRRRGSDILGQIASSPDEYAFYDFAKIAGTPVAGSRNSADSTTVAFGEPILAVLSVAASRDSQAALVEIAVRPSELPARREAAADALLLSIQRAGILLNGDDLLRLARTRQELDDDAGKAIDRVLAVIGRRSDVGGITTESDAGTETSQPKTKRVSPPDI